MQPPRHRERRDRSREDQIHLGALRVLAVKLFFPLLGVLGASAVAFPFLLSFTVPTIPLYNREVTTDASTNSDSLLDGLTDPQRQAVTHVDGPLLIVAAAGSGKTRVITRRVGYLMSLG